MLEYLCVAGCPALQDPCRKANVAVSSLKAFATDLREEHAAAFKALELMEREAVR